MTIFLDLDETLAHSIPGRRGNPGRRRVVRIDDGDTYWVMERPSAKRMIEDCQALAPTFILSASSHDYAFAVCMALGFGFKQEEVFGRQQYLAPAPRNTVKVIQNGFCPSAILIDNAAPDSESVRCKSAFLGIPASRFIQVRTFRGKDSPHFPSDWEFLVSKLRTLS